MKYAPEVSENHRILLKKFAKTFCKASTTGISYFLPVIIVAGFSYSITLLTGTINDGKIIPSNDFFAIILAIGQAGFAMMIPVLCAYIAYTLGGKTALAPGFILGYVTNVPLGSTQLSTGFIGAVLLGILVGYFVHWMNTWNVPAGVESILSSILIPLLATLVIGLVYAYILIHPLNGFVQMIVERLNGFSGKQAIVLGLVIGLLASLDMGGMCSKAATAFTLALLAEGIYAPNGAFRVCCAVPPLGLALSTFLSQKKYSEEERKYGITALCLSTVGITESALPFVAKDYKRVIPATVIGTSVAGGLAMIHGIESIVAFGGLFALPAVTAGKLWYVADMLIGAFVIVAILHFIKPNQPNIVTKQRRNKDEKS